MVSAPSAGQALAVPAHLFALAHPVGQQRLLHSDYNQAYWPLANYFETQRNQAYCSVATSVMALNALGVARPVVVQDYLMTNDLYQMPKANPAGLSPEVLNVLWRVQSNFLDAAFQAVEADYGHVSAYLERALGVNAKAQERLAALYLQA